MTPRPGGRYCARCDKTVLDLTGMSRERAEARVRALADEPELCVQLAVDRFGDPVFRPPPRRAPHWARGLVMVAALTGAGCSSAEAASWSTSR